RLQKTLLFFLEVDMGTESIQSERPDASNIRGKFDAYITCFASGAYKRFEHVFCSSLNGFRVLLVCNSLGRFRALCRHIAQWPDSGFVWVTHEQCLHEYGLGAPIWAPGGRLDVAPQSLLGSTMPPKLARQVPLWQ
ncbi:MAG: hypothetical protein ABSH20_08385, partial [Tepidisphaeraceae bacterium]